MNKEKIINNWNIVSHCRSKLKPGLYMILPQDSKVESIFSNMKKVTCCVLTTSALGANFNQYELYFEPGGIFIFNNISQEIYEHFLFVLEGSITIEFDNVKNKKELMEGGYAYLPPNTIFKLVNHNDKKSRLIHIKKKYKPINSSVPKKIFNNESKIVGEYRDTHIEQHLIPHERDISYDMAVNLLNFDLGVCFGFVETHVMEHGLYMLNGNGVYWLNGDFFEVQTDDYIYMAPYCPQYFYCTGSGKARYLIYKETNRDYND